MPFLALVGILELHRAEISGPSTFPPTASFLSLLISSIFKTAYKKWLQILRVVLYLQLFLSPVAKSPGGS